MRFRDGVEDHFLIQRFDRTKIDDLGRNIFLFELSGDSEREGHSLRVTDDRYIAAFAFHFRLPQRNEQFFVWRFNHSFRAVEKLKVMNSMIGRNPTTAAPMPSPAKPFSLIGVSTIRFGPNRSSSPWLTL